MSFKKYSWVDIIITSPYYRSIHLDPVIIPSSFDSSGPYLFLFTNIHLRLLMLDHFKNFTQLFLHYSLNEFLWGLLVGSAVLYSPDSDG
jgi:hypothetical protein